MAILSKLACCFRPPSSAAAARRRGRRQEAAVRRRPDKAEKKRWVDEQVGLHLAARTWDGYGYGAGYGKGGAVDVSRYGDIGLEVALGYEFERRWWFAETTRLLASFVDDAPAAAAAGKSGVVKVHPLAAEQRLSAAGDGATAAKPCAVLCACAL